MPRQAFFPDPRFTLHGGLLAITTDIDADMLEEAYSRGIFPWPQQESPILWFCPEERGVIDFHEFKVPKSFAKVLKRTHFNHTWNLQFENVMRECKTASRPGQQGTWITEKLILAYLEFHRRGFAQSVEVWSGDKLVGGLYGVRIKNLFAGESMFYHESGASKFALFKTVEDLRARGLTWIDVQMVTPVVESFGAKYISREKFLARLNEFPDRPNNAP